MPSRTVPNDPALSPAEPGPFAVRPAADADGPAIARVIATAFSAYENCLFVPAEFPELAAVASHYRARDGIIFVAEGGGGVVGSLAVFRTADPAVFELCKVYLLEAARGRGLAGRMLGLAEAFAADRGGERLRLWTDTRFERGHAFYRKAGFRRLPVVRYLADASATWEFAYHRPIGAAHAR